MLLVYFIMQASDNYYDHYISFPCSGQSIPGVLSSPSTSVLLCVDVPGSEESRGTAGRGPASTWPPSSHYGPSTQATGKVMREGRLDQVIGYSIT